MLAIVAVVGVTVIAIAVGANKGSGTYPEAAAAVMKQANPSSEDIAAAYCGIKVSDLTFDDTSYNSDIPANQWLPGTGAEDNDFRYSSGMGTMVFSDTVGGAGSDTPWVGVIVKCPNGSVGTVQPA